MNTIYIYLIEDSISYRMDLKQALTKYFEDHNSSILFTIQPINNYIAFYETLEKKQINDNDIFFIDIFLNTYFTGIDFGKKIRQINQVCNIIFLTSASDKAITTINEKIYPSAYLLKSEYSEINQIQIFDLFDSLNLKVHDTDNRIAVTSSSSSSNFIIKKSDILFISVLKGHRKKLFVKTRNSDLVIDGTLSNIKSKLSSPTFYLDFKSVIINNDAIKSISPINHSLIFQNDYEFEMNSKSLYKLLKFQKEPK